MSKPCSDPDSLAVMNVLHHTPPFEHTYLVDGNQYRVSDIRGR